MDNNTTNHATTSSTEARGRAEAAAKLRQRLVAEIGKVVFGQHKVVDEVLITLLAGGHALLVGVPGLGKTLLVKTLAQMLSLTFKRVQFTPDLMPADIFGTEVLEEDRATGKRCFRFIKGPVFANVLLADEINRTPPKTQAALLEAMEERQVTAAGETHVLDEPFLVLATQNPIELEGTYPLPEAQLDRFMLNIVLDYLDPESECDMVAQTTATPGAGAGHTLSGAEILEMRRVVREVSVSRDVISFAVGLVNATRPTSPAASEFVKRNVRWGAGARASQALVLCGKARALLDGRCNVSRDDVLALAMPVMRHRVVTSFHADAEGISVDQVIAEIISNHKH